MRKFQLLAASIYLIIACGCSGYHSNQEGIVSVKPLEVTNIVEDLSPYIDEICVVPAGNDSVCLSAISKLVFDDDRFLALSAGAVFRMDGRGQVIQIGRVGRGPGEYISIRDIAVNINGTELWCLDVSNKVLRFCLKDGSFISEINASKMIGEARCIIPTSEDTFLLYIPNPFSHDMASKARFSCIQKFNIVGESLGDDLPWQGFHIDSSFSNPVSCFEGNYILMPESSEPGIIFSKDRENTRIWFDFGRKNIPNNYFLKDGKPWDKVGDLFEEDYYKLISSVYFPQGDTYFRAFGQSSSVWNFYIPQNGTSGIRWQSVGVFTPPIGCIGSSGGYLYFPYYDYGQNDNEIDPLKKCVIQKYGLPGKKDMTYLIKVKFNV